MVLAVIRRSISGDARFRSEASPCEIRGGQSGTETGVSPSI
jgi:hypothetical protein